MSEIKKAKEIGKTGTHKYLLHACIDCGKERWVQFRKGKPLSLRCRKCSKTGKLNHFWRGGRYAIGRGYILIRAPNHPRAHKCKGSEGYILEHILVWEQAHGKPLPEGWIIHHLNGITSDNRPKNLVALPNKKHYLVLQAKAKRIQELEAMVNNQHQLL